MIYYSMRRADVIETLRAHAEAIRAFGVTELYLYGSAARDEAGADSDIDLFVEVDYDRFGFVPFMDLREFMRKLFGRKVDLTTRNALHPDLKDNIVRSAIKVFDEESVDSVPAE
jgi:predicted nucleotidyltransferase